MTGLERLRDLVDGMIEWSVYTIMKDDWCSRNGVNSCGDGVAMKKLLCEIADQIEWEHLREVDDVSGRDADAVAWVESHGGIAECDRKVEASMEVGDKYTLLRMELGKLLGYDLMGQLDASDEELVEKIGKRLMPDGVEWPRFETGEPVKLGDSVEDGDGDDVDEGKAVYITFFDDHSEIGLFNGVTSWQTSVLKGDFVKRPAPKVLDADGVEIREGDVLYSVESGDYVIVDSIEPGNPWFATTDGTLQHCSKFIHRAPVLAADGEPLKVGQTVWNINNGMEFNVSRLPKPGEYQAVEVRYRNGSSTSFDSCQLTHQRPVLDADGNRIEPPMDVWWVCEGDEFGIHAERLHVDSIDGDGMVECRPFNGGTSVVLEPSELYVKKPALDADGVPIKKGDTVFRASDGREFEVTGIGGAFTIRVKDESMEIGVWTTPVGFTHVKPEPPDSWDRIEEDAGCTATKYNERRGTIFTSKQQVARDLVRRCKALAERGE